MFYLLSVKIRGVVMSFRFNKYKNLLAYLMRFGDKITWIRVVEVNHA